MNCCRTCMSTKSLNPIFQCVDKSNKYTDILAMSTGLKILTNDSLPQVICTNCVNFINKYQDFRETCQRSHRILIKSIKNEKLINNSISLKSEIDKHVVITNVKIEETSDFDTNNDNDYSNNDYLDCGEELVIVKSKETIEFDISIEDLMKMKIDLPLKKTICVTNIKLKSKDDNVRSEAVKRRKGIEKSDVEEGKVKSSYIAQKSIDIECEDERDVEATSEVEESKDIEDNNAVKGKKNKFKCNYCNKVLKSEKSLKSHHRLHTGRKYFCEHCGKFFINKIKLLMHCKSKHGYKKTDKCSYCDFMGCTRASVQIHERLHTGEKPYVCQKCGASFHRRSTHLQHIAIHLPEKTVQCDVCPARFKSTTLMRIHKNRRHRAPQYSFRCRVCDNMYARRRSATLHYRRTHGMDVTNQDIERLKINRI